MQAYGYSIFLYLKPKKQPRFFYEVGGWCYHARNLPKFIKMNFCFGCTYGLAMIASVATLNICQILMRLNGKCIQMSLQVTIVKVKPVVLCKVCIQMNVPL